jgi:hypothetical protein
MNIRILTMVLVLLVVLEAPAMGYTNPGAGLLIWQLALAAFFGLVYQMRKFLGRRRKE